MVPRETGKLFRLRVLVINLWAIIAGLAGPGSKGVAIGYRFSRGSIHAGAGPPTAISITPTNS